MATAEGESELRRAFESWLAGALSPIRLSQELLAVARREPEAVLNFGEERAQRTRAAERTFAAIAIQAAAAYADASLLESDLEPQLIRWLAAELDPAVADEFASALLQVWGRRDALGAELAMAAHHSPNVRLAAAKALALQYPDPPPRTVEDALARLREDEDSRVRSWARSS